MQSDYFQAEEQVKLAYMSVKTEIMTQTAMNSSYNATKQENAEKLLDIVKKDLTGGVWTPTPYFSTEYTTISITFTKSSLRKDGISAGVPAQDGCAKFKITLEPQDARYDIDEDASNSGSGDTGNTDDVYRGLATENEVNQDMYYYQIITPATASIKDETKVASTDGLQLATTNTPGTAAIMGINLEYIFTKELGANQSQWPAVDSSISSGANSTYINAMKSYLNKIVIPHKVKLNSNGEPDSNGKEYQIVEIDDLLGVADNYSGLIGSNSWGNDSINWPVNYNDWTLNLGSTRGILFHSPNLNMKIIIPEGITQVNGMSIGPYRDINVSDISFPETLESLGFNCCEGFVGLTELTIPASVRYINSSCFVNCDNLKKITAPMGVANAGDCYGVWPQNLEEFIANGGTNVGGAGYSEFYNCSKLRKITFPNTLHSIGQSAFYQSQYLTSITLPESVTTIESGALDYECSITDVYLNSTTLNIDEYAFSGTSVENVYLNTQELASLFYSGNFYVEGPYIQIKSNVCDSDKNVIPRPDEWGYGAYILKEPNKDGYARYEFDSSYDTNYQSNDNSDASDNSDG